MWPCAAKDIVPGREVEEVDGWRMELDIKPVLEL